MKIPVYNIAPCHWTQEIWEMTKEEREKIGIKIVYIDDGR